MFHKYFTYRVQIRQTEEELGIGIGHSNIVDCKQMKTALERHFTFWSLGGSKRLGNRITRRFKISGSFYIATINTTCSSLCGSGWDFLTQNSNFQSRKSRFNFGVDVQAAEVRSNDFGLHAAFACCEWNMHERF